MKKDRIQGFVSGVISTCLVISISLTAFATIGEKNIVAYYDDIKVYVNEKLANLTDANGNTVEPFIYNGTTYLPVRAISEALGQEVSWHDESSSVYIGRQPSDISSNYSLSNPAPLDTPQDADVDGYLNDYSCTVTVTEIIRGQDAWDKLYAVNRFNPEPIAGYEYILARVKVSASYIEDNGSTTINQFDFTSFSSDNSQYEQVSVVKPNPVLDGKIYTGGNLEGYVAFQVRTDDEAPKLAFGQNSDGTGGAWFRLY